MKLKQLTSKTITTAMVLSVLFSGIAAKSSALDVLGGSDLVDAFSVMNDDNRTYQMIQNENLSESLGTMAGSGATLTVNGGGYEILGNGNEGAIIDDETNTLNLTNIKNIDGFKDDIFIKNAGTINLSGVTINNKITGFSSSNANVIIQGDTDLNSVIENNSLFLNDGILRLGQMADISNTNMIVANGGTLSLQNGVIQNTNLGNLKLNDDLNLMLDGNFAKMQIDTITAKSFEANNFYINITDINILEPTTKEFFSISPIGSGMDEAVRQELAQAFRYSGGEMVYSPIYKYIALYDLDSYTLNFIRTSGDDYESFNPSVVAAPVAAQLGGYLTQLNVYDNAFRNMDMYMLMSQKEREAMKQKNKYAGITDNNLVFDPTVNQYENRSGWFRPYTTFENVSLDNGPKVSNVAYGALFGTDSELYELSNGWDGMWSVYGGYNGSHQAYDGISIYQNGGTIGATGMLYKGNFFTGLTANVGANAGEASTLYGREDFTMLMSGLASKSGYNIEFAEGKFIIQPSLLMSYTFVNTFDYRNAIGVDINSDPLHAIQIEPGIKFIGNLKNGWQPYAGVSVVWNIMDETKFEANDVSLPDLSIDPFVRYGIGVRKAWGEKFTGFLQTYITNGGRNGVGLQGGFRWTLGKLKTENKPNTQAKAKEIEISKAKITLNNLK